MAIFLSPGVFPREIDLSVLPTDTSSVIPAFIGTAKRGPMNKPMFITTPEEFVDVFGEPFPQSQLGYAVLAYLQDGNACWVLRVGVECEDGQDPALADICVDTSGNRIGGWGRIPVFTGIDFGRINLRVPTTSNPFSFHDDSISSITFSDFELAGTFGPASATLNFTGLGLSDEYTGPIDDSFTILITSNPTGGSAQEVMNGATYEIIRGHDGVIIGTGVLQETSVGSQVSTPIAIGSGTNDSGLIVSIVVSGSSPLGINDTFTFEVVADNRVFSVEVEGTPSSPSSFTMPIGDISDPDTFVTTFNSLVGSSVPFLAAYDGTNLQIRTTVAGNRIQITDTEGFALHVGVAKWTFDIPRSHIQTDLVGPFNIGSQNNQAVINLIESATTTTLNAPIPVGLGYSSANIASALDLGSIKLGQKYYDSFAIHITDDDEVIVIAASATHQFGQVKLLADFSHLATLKFAETVGFLYPYTAGYRVFNDSRVSLPTQGAITPSDPLSCETDPLSAQCALDSAYFANIVGFFVATSPGTWLDDWTLTIANFNGQAGRWTLRLYDPSGIEDADGRVDNFSFDPLDTRYIGNIVNPGSALGGLNGHKLVNWEERPTFLENDINDPSNFVVRQPGPLNKVLFVGMQNGIPLDATFSSEIDRVTIGNPATSTGIFAFQNPEAYDITLLLTPGNSSGAVIGQALAMCEGRGDCLYLVDPPFGLRPQQVVDWHNGMLLSDLSAPLNSSYGALYWSWLKVSDLFNGGQIFVPPSGYIAGVFAKTARDAELWFAPAGLNRGRLLTVLDVEFNPSMGERDLLYGFGNAVNPLVKFPEGITVWGQRTLQRKDSALDRVNVRMLLIALKKALIPLLRNFIFEPNDPILWGQVRSAVNPLLADIAARRGITEYLTICDATNNTPIRRDRNELWVSVIVKPTRAVEFVVLNLVVLRTDASFAAEEVLAAAGVVGAVAGA